MTPQRFRQIRNVFDALMEREPSTRTVFLEEACQGDEELRSEVGRLIAAHEQAPGGLDQLVGDGLREAQEPSPGDEGTNEAAPRRLEGRHIGLRELGAGGMGTVYSLRVAARPLWADVRYGDKPSGWVRSELPATQERGTTPLELKT